MLSKQVLSLEYTKRVHCSILVFVCWAFIAASATRQDLDIQKPWYLRRDDWQAKPAHEIELLKLPVPYVLIGHSASESCTDRYNCISEVLSIQHNHQIRGWHDIGPNFLVGGKGLIFEGRGANVLGVMVSQWNRVAISIMFIGNYNNAEPVQEQFDNINTLLEELVKKGVLTPTYTLFGHCQVVNGIIAPGIHIMDNLHNFEHWNPANKTGCLRY